eukprot:gb/GEZN01002324.1/.p1 GENE.gb/GEZN01002324.1/~~gb/GEZN01002324.1/.p1  ORF type:complete len:763 (-),score=147.37 gb/GEZN01002324.1/:51-2339(-)
MLKSLASKAKAVGSSVAEAVGYVATNEDAQLTKYKQDLARLESAVSSLRAQMTHYATSMQSLSQAACATSSEVERFYAKSTARAQSVKLFTDANFQLEAFTTEIWKEQMDTEIMAKFDAWVTDIKQTKAMVKRVQQGTLQVNHLGEKVEALKGAKEKREQKGAALNEKEQQILDQHQEKFNNFTKALDKMRKQLDKDMKRVLDGRYTAFDACFVRFMECQVEFFQHAQGQVQKFLPNINNYRKRFPLNANGATEATGAAGEEETMEPADLSALKAEAQKKLGGKPSTFPEELVGEGDVPPTPPTSARGKKTSGRNQDNNEHILDLSNSPQAGSGELLEGETVRPKTIPASPMESRDDPFNAMFPSSPPGQGSDPSPTPPPSQEKSAPVNVNFMDDDIEEDDMGSVDFSGVSASDPPPTPPVSFRGNKDSRGPASPPSSGFPSDFSVSLDTEFASGSLDLSAADDRVAPTPPVSSRGPQPSGNKHALDIDKLSSKLKSVGASGATAMDDAFPDLSSPPTFSEDDMDVGSKSASRSTKASKPSSGQDDFLAGFDDGFGSNPGFDNNPGNASPDKEPANQSEGEFDEFEFFGDAVKKTQPRKPEPAAPSASNSKVPESEMTDANKRAAGELDAKISLETESSLAQARRLEAEKVALHEAKRKIDDSVLAKINNWEFKNGRTKPRKGMRALLNSLDNVLWEGTNWKKVSVATLMEKSKVKIAYRKALLIVHPDKIDPSSSPEIQVIAERVFHTLNEEWKVFEKSGE